MWILYIFKFDAPSGYSGDDYVTSVEPRITFYETYDEAKNEIYKLALKHYEYATRSERKKKYFKSAQWLRNVKDRKYPFYRVDTYFSEKKYINCEFVDNGGWHFTNIKTAKQIKQKLESYLHHIEFDKNPLSAKDIDKIIQDKIAIYDLSVDQRKNKIRGNKLENYPLDKLPKYLQDNLNNYKDWID